MSSSFDARASMSPEVRTSIFYFTMFMLPGVVGSYFGIWLTNKGISASEIGMINSLPVLFMLVINVVVGRIADRADDWRSVIIIGMVLAGIAPIGLFFTDSFLGILILWALATVPFAAIAPVADAATVRMTRRRGTDFAFIRAWGTIGYMVLLVATGYFVSGFGPDIFVPLVVAAGFIRMLAAFILPKFRGEKGEAAPVQPLVAQRIGEVFKPWFILPVVGVGLLMGTMMLINAFVALVWKNAGVPENLIGPLLALGALSEVGLMFVFAKIARRFTARNLILIAAVVTAVRWAIMAFNPPVWALMLLQLTHGISFGFAYLGLVNFIANWTSEDMAAEVQSLAVVVQQGITVVAVLGFGYLLEWFDMLAFLVAAGFCVVAAICTWISLRLNAAA